jgi:hypothetical protein
MVHGRRKSAAGALECAIFRQSIQNGGEEASGVAILIDR